MPGPGLAAARRGTGGGGRGAARRSTRSTLPSRSLPSPRRMGPFPVLARTAPSPRRPDMPAARRGSRRATRIEFHQEIHADDERTSTGFTAVKPVKIPRRVERLRPSLRRPDRLGGDSDASPPAAAAGPEKACRGTRRRSCSGSRCGVWCTAAGPAW